MIVDLKSLKYHSLLSTAQKDSHVLIKESMPSLHIVPHDVQSGCVALALLISL